MGENETAKRTVTVESADYRTDSVVIVLVFPKGFEPAHFERSWGKTYLGDILRNR